jgi:hypothetical protein
MENKSLMGGLTRPRIVSAKELQITVINNIRLDGIVTDAVDLSDVLDTNLCPKRVRQH